MVKENKTTANEFIPGNVIVVDNYLEAVGIITCIKEGIMPESVRRPLPYTKILTEENND